MTAGVKAVEAGDREADEFAAAVASDLDMLAALHDREPTAAIVGALQQAPLGDRLALVLAFEPALSTLAAFALALD